MHFLPPRPPSLILQKRAITLQLLVLNTPPPLIDVLLQGQGKTSPSTSAVRTYAPLLSALITQRFEPPLESSNVTDPLHQI